MGRVVVIEDDAHKSHASPGHPERPDRVEAIRARLAAVAHLRDIPRITARAVDDDALLRVHDRDHLARVAVLCARGGGQFDVDTYATAASDTSARVSAGGAISAVEAVVSGDFDAAFAVVRPPGHHATASRAMGFCIYNNVAVAVQHARAVHGVRRVAVVDVDVHHGNGTEDLFWNDPAVLYASLHQHPFYPGTGSANDRGGPEAAGLTVNVPVPPGTEGEAWLAAFDAMVAPALHSFAPELVVVSCGFDAHRDDPLAELMLDTRTYAELAERLTAMTSLPSGGRTAWVLEGGYDLEALAASSQAVLDVLLAG